MITIQGFARLCGCNTQTLRYYDRIGLLTPAKVDGWTGYRYYDEEQAMLFVKIKNLQQADFSIEEIKMLLAAEDDVLMAAFDRKIREQQQRLGRIMEIKRTYLEEAMDMRNMISTITGYVEGRMDNPALWEEFGLDADRGSEISAKVHEMLADWLAECRNAGREISMTVDEQQFDGLKDVTEKMKDGTLDGAETLLLTGGAEIEKDIPAGAETVFERCGWDHVSEWIGELPDLGNGKQKFFLFRVRQDSAAADPGFPMLMLAVAAVRFNAMNGGMACRIGLSGDGRNHFTLLQQ